MNRSVLRSTLAWVAGVAMISALAACSSAAPPEGGGEVTSLVVYSADPAQAAVYQEALDVFAEQNNVEIELISYPSADFIQNFTSAVNANSQIDVLLANGQDIRFFNSKGLLRDLTGAVETSDLQPTAVEPFKIGDGLYGLGAGTLNTTAWVYNAEIFEQHDLTPPETFDDVIAIAKQLEGTDIAAMSVPGGNIYLWPIWLMQAIQQASGGTAVDTTFATLDGSGPKFSDQVYVDALAALGELGAGNVFANGYQALQQETANSLFAEGKAAMFFGGTWDVSSIVTMAPDLDLRVIPFPSFVPGVQPGAFGGTGVAAAVYSKAPEAQQAMGVELVQYLTGADATRIIAAGSTSAINLPSVKSVVPANSSPVADAIINDLLPNTVVFLDWYWPKEVTASFQTGIQAVVGGQQTPEQAAQAAQAAFEEAIAAGWVLV